MISTQKTSTNLYEANQQWATRPADQRFQTLEQLRDSVHARRLRCRSTDIAKAKVIAEVSGENGIVINQNIAPCAPSHWAFGQLCQASRINDVSAPASYMRQLPADLAVRCLNEGFKNGDRDAHKFMTITPEDPEQPGILQAVTSTTYGRIWDADCVDAVQRIVERSGGKFFNPKAYKHIGAPNGFKSIDTSSTEPAGLYASDHDVFMFMIDGGSLLDGGNRAQLHRGFIVWNSETGAKTFGLMTFLFNAVCGNNIIWGAQDVNKLIIRHTSGGPARFDTEAAPRLREYIEASAAPLVDTVKRAQAYLLPPSDKPEFLEWMNKHAKFTKSEIANAVHYAKAEEGDCRTLWNFVQGATAYARGFDFVDTRIELEKRAGALLDIVANN